MKNYCRPYGSQIYGLLHWKSKQSSTSEAFLGFKSQTKVLTAKVMIYILIKPELLDDILRASLFSTMGLVFIGRIVTGSNCCSDKSLWDEYRWPIKYGPNRLGRIVFEPFLWFHTISFDIFHLFCQIWTNLPQYWWLCSKYSQRYQKFQKANTTKHDNFISWPITVRLSSALC